MQGRAPCSAFTVCVCLCLTDWFSTCLHSHRLLSSIIQFVSWASPSLCPTVALFVSLLLIALLCARVCLCTALCVGVCLLTAFSLGPQCWVCWTASGWTETESAGKDRTSMCESAAHTGKHHQLSFLPSDINRTGNWETRALTSPLTCSDDEPLCFSGLMVWTFSLYKLIHLFVNQTCSKSADASSNNPVS